MTGGGAGAGAAKSRLVPSAVGDESEFSAEAVGDTSLLPTGWSLAALALALRPGGAEVAAAVSVLGSATVSACRRWLGTSLSVRTKEGSFGTLTRTGCNFAASFFSSLLTVDRR